jgi:membrane protease YdiL (CAAX protease family)
MAAGSSNRDGNNLQNILTSIGLRTKNPLLEFLLGFSSIAIVVAVLMFFLGNPAIQPINHLFQGASLWLIVIFTFLAVAAQTILLPGVVLVAIERLINTRVALVLSALTFGLTFKASVFGNYFDWFLTIGMGLTGLFFCLVFVATRSLWVIFGIRAVLNMLEVSINDSKTIYEETARILEQSKPPSTSLGILLVAGPSFDGDLQHYIWLAMNLASVILIIFLVLQSRKRSSTQNERKSL